MTNILEKGIQSNQTKSTTVVDKNPLNLAASWYVAMLSKELGKKPKAIQLFSRDLVAWRDGNGTPVIMERYCSHMGASLAIGEVKDGCIQCPFHHWRYDNSGNCVSIPDIENIPPTARQATYVTQERYGYIWVWYGTQTPLFPLPEFPAAEDEKHNYMPFRFVIKSKATVRRILENAHDYSHLIPIHHWSITSMQVTLLDDLPLESQLELPSKNELWFRISTEFKLKGYFGIMGTLAQILGLKAEIFLLQINSWPGGHLVTVTVNSVEKFQALVGSSPVAENNTAEHVLIMVKKSRFFWLNPLYYAVFGLQNNLTTNEDLPIWNTMKPDGGGTYTKNDRPVLKYREFYQKWVNKVKV